MYNGIGIQTARGTGTNGYVQANLSHLLLSRRKIEYNAEEDLRRAEAEINRRPNEDLLDHQRKRVIEMKCAEFEMLMENKGFDEAEITKKINDYRRLLLSQLESGELNVDDEICKKDTHTARKMAAAQRCRMKDALGIKSDFVPGSSMQNMNKNDPLAEDDAKTKAEKEKAEQEAAKLKALAKLAKWNKKQDKKKKKKKAALKKKNKAKKNKKRAASSSSSSSSDSSSDSDSDSDSSSSSSSSSDSDSSDSGTEERRKRKKLMKKQMKQKSKEVKKEPEDSSDDEKTKGKRSGGESKRKEEGADGKRKEVERERDDDRRREVNSREDNRDTRGGRREDERRDPKRGDDRRRDRRDSRSPDDRKKRSRRDSSEEGERKKRRLSGGKEREEKEVKQEPTSDGGDKDDGSPIQIIENDDEPYVDSDLDEETRTRMKSMVTVVKK